MSLCRLLLGVVVLAGLLSVASSFSPAALPRSGLRARKTSPPIPDSHHVVGVPSCSGGTTLFSLASDEAVGTVIGTMLKSSEFVYTYAMIRSVVNDHDLIEGNSEDKFKEQPKIFGIIPRKERQLVKFFEPELVVTQRGSQIVNPNRYLLYPVTAAAMLRFVGGNRNFLQEEEGSGDITFQSDEEIQAMKSENLPKLKMEDKLEMLQRFDGELLDYDDKFTSQEGLVYGITINRSKKRVTVIFRGTVGGKDILTDARFWPHTPDLFKDLKGNVKVHSGFASYLFDPVEEIDGTYRSKFERIVAAVKEVLESDNPLDGLKGDDPNLYELYVSGHSLGGALSNLFAFAVAGTQDYKYFKRITAVTFAAPVVGNDDYDREFQAMEAEGKLRHIRISNQGDIVPTNPSPFRYTQNGVNMHLFDDDKMEYCYGNKKSLLSQLNFGVLDKHMPPEYTSRLSNGKNEEIFAKTLEEVYMMKGALIND